MQYRTTTSTTKMVKLLITMLVYSLVNLLVAESGLEKVILQSPNVTDFGEWGPLEECPIDTFVTRFQLAVEEKSNRPDNSALNGVQFHCGRINYSPDNQPAYFWKLLSAVGRNDEFSEVQMCGENAYAIGFQLKSQSYMGPFGDDVAAINLKLICSDGSLIEGHDEKGNYFPKSDYTDARYCPDDQAICGLQTQVESYQGLGDDTSLNNIRVTCCDVNRVDTTTTTTTSTTGESLAPVAEEPSSTTESAVAEEEPSSSSTTTTEEPATEFTTTDEPMTTSSSTAAPEESSPSTSTSAESSTEDAL